MLMTGSFLLIKGYKNGMNNVIITGIGFMVLPLGFIGNFLFNLGYLFQESFIIFCYILITIFTNMTFHKNRGFRPKSILIVIIMFSFIQFLFFFIAEFGVWTSYLYYIRVLFDIPYTLLVFNWLGFSSLFAWRSIKLHPIEPWIKMRYKMIAFFSIIFSFHAILELFQPPGTAWGDFNNIISLTLFGSTTLLANVFSIGFLTAWMMPNLLKRYFNRNYEKLEEIEYSENQLLDDLKKQLSDKREREFL